MNIFQMLHIPVGDFLKIIRLEINSGNILICSGNGGNDLISQSGLIQCFLQFLLDFLLFVKDTVYIAICQKNIKSLIIYLCLHHIGFIVTVLSFLGNTAVMVGKLLFTQKLSFHVCAKMPLKKLFFLFIQNEIVCISLTIFIKIFSRMGILLCHLPGIGIRIQPQYLIFTGIKIYPV